MHSERKGKKYIDKNVGEYRRIFPLTEYSTTIDLKCSESIKSALKTNAWYEISREVEQEIMIKKLEVFEKLIDKLFSLLFERNPILQINHISIAGSFLYNNDRDKVRGPNDIDFNVLVEGSHFDYFNVYNVDFFKRFLTQKIRKVSFMIFGEDNIFKGEPNNDSLEAEGYIHTDLTIREGLIFSWRNGTIFGRTFIDIAVNRYNLLVRIARQLYQAQLFLQNKIGRDRSLFDRRKKALDRIVEAFVLLNKTFKYARIPVENVLAKRMEIYKKHLSFILILNLYEEILDWYLKLYQELPTNEQTSLQCYDILKELLSKEKIR